jgi:hypothetical protein
VVCRAFASKTLLILVGLLQGWGTLGTLFIATGDNIKTLALITAIGIQVQIDLMKKKKI